MHGRVERRVRVGLIGCGVVGTGTLQILRDNAASLTRRLGAPIEVRRVVAKDRDKPRPDVLGHLLGTGGQLSFDPNDVLDDPEVDIVVELAGGLEPAGTWVRRALEQKKSVVTANKFLLAEHGHALFELAENNGVDLYFEAAVCGGIPVIRVLREALASDTVLALRGIVNGTSNFILTRMQDEGLDYSVALKLAQEAGYAEADPSLDVNGGDASHKLTILSTLAFGAKLVPSDISVEGIEHLTALDMQMAARFGRVVKLLATGRALPGWDGAPGPLDLRVHPALIKKTSPLASVSGALNAVHIEGERLGPCLITGYGAGAMPTAMSVVSDLVDVGRNLLIGASGRVPQRAVTSAHLSRRAIQSSGAHTGSYYLRFPILDRPGVLARIVGILGAFDVPIEHMLQEARAAGTKDPVQVVVFTHKTRDASIRSAFAETQRLSGIAAPPVAIRLEDV
jgi:homoserine dehydrogenase